MPHLTRDQPTRTLTRPSACRRLLLGLVLALWCGAAAGQAKAPAYGPRLVHTPAFERLAWLGLDRMYNMDWRGADSAFVALERQHPEHPAPPFVRAANLWWQVTLDLTDTRHDAELMRLLELVIARSQRLIDARGEDFEADFLLFAALGYKARLMAARGQYWKASNVALKALGPLKRGMRNKAQLTEFLFGSGLYNYFVIWYGEYRPIVKPFLTFFPSGDKALGLRELEASTQKRNYTQIESAVFMCEIYLDYERQYAQAERFAKLLNEHYPANLLFRYYHARSHYHSGDLAEARRLIEPLLAGYPAREPTAPIRLNGSNVTTQLFAWSALLMGEVHLAEGRAAEALPLLDRAQRAVLLLGWSENEWLARVLLQRGRALDRLGRRAEAVACYRQVSEVANAPKLTKRDAEACLRAPCN